MQPKASEAGADGVVLVKRSSFDLDNTTPPFWHPSSTEEGSSRFPDHPNAYCAGLIPNFAHNTKSARA